MGIKDIMLDTESKRGKQFYTKMLKWLDSPNREIFDNSQKLVAYSGIQPGQTVLEIGCGSGFFTLPASKIIGSEGILYSTDIHSIAIEETQRKVEKLGLKNVIVKKDNALNSSFKDEMFDLVFLYGVVPAPVISMEDISREIYRLLKPGGIYAIWTKVPFWTPAIAIKKVSFESIKKQHGVFQLRKIQDISKK